MTKFKIVFTIASTGDSYTESFNVECHNPLAAVRAYVEWTIQSSTGVYEGAQVFPLTEQALFTIGMLPKAKINSELYEGYAVYPCSAVAPSCDVYTDAPKAAPKAVKAPKTTDAPKTADAPNVVPKVDEFETINSSWIRFVSWQASNSSIGVHFKDGNYIVYASNYATFYGFKLWIDHNGSPGHFYNTQIKGKCVIIKSRSNHS